MSNDLSVQNQLFNFQGINFTVVIINNIPHWIAKEICEFLEIKNHSDAVLKLKEGTQKVKLSHEESMKIGLGELQDLKIGVKGIMLLKEAGIYKLTFKSEKPNADDFTDWLSEKVIPAVRRTGKFDMIENNIMLIEDETERNLTLTIHNLKQTLTTNPNDMLMQFAYNSKVTDLTTYKQSRELKLMQNQVKQLANKVSDVQADNELIKGQQIFVCDRTNFSEKMKVLANKYFGRDSSKAYNALFNKMKILGSFDVYARRKNEWDRINEERVEEGKEPYKASTLKGKVNYLDIIDKHDRWELCSEAYKTIETVEYKLHIV